MKLAKSRNVLDVAKMAAVRKTKGNGGCFGYDRQASANDFLHLFLKGA